MASSYGRGDFAAGLSSPSSSASFDSDNDTDLDSIEAEIQSHGYHLPFLDQQSLQQPPHQYAPPERYSSLRPDIEYDYGDVRPHPSQQYQLSGEDMQYFDQSWTDFHDKRRQRRAQAPGTLIYTERSVDDIMNGRHYQDKRYDAHAYEFPRHRQPLVKLTRNGRHSDSRVKFHSAWSYDDSNPSSPTLSQVLSAPRPRRWLVILVTSIIFLAVYWRQYGAEAWHEHKTLSTAIQDKMQSNLGYFGTNMLPEFVGMTHLKTLDEALVPRSGDRKRLIIVGDVHGCVDELQALLSKLKFKLGSDHLIFAGDLISRGPSSSETIDLAMASQASCVRGNHEDRVLLAYRDMQIHHSLLPHPIKISEGTEAAYPPEPEPNAKPAENKDGESFLSGDHVEQVLARSLSNEHVQYLASCPVILDIGPIRGLGEVRVVHAGLVPGVALRRQDPVSVMHMLTLDLETHVPSHVNDGTAWSKVWNKYQTFLPKKERSTVVYGHDSRRGLQLGKYTKGLDTGCVKGGKLTALILTSGNNKKPKTISVDCKDYRPKRAPSGEELGQS